MRKWQTQGRRGIKNSRTTYHPAGFFLITILITWCLEFIAAYFSYQNGMEEWQVIFMIIGLGGPFVTAMIMLYRANSQELWRDYLDRVVNLKRINLTTMPVMLFLFPCAIVISIFLSLLFGKSMDQFTLTPQSSFTVGSVPVLLFLIIIPALEELGWRGYGVDSLRSRFNLLITSLWFSVLWAIWHVPMFFINHTYMHGLLSNWVYTANYFISIFPVAFIVNWLFYKNNRSIIACFLFHMVTDVSAEIFAVEQFTKCIDTAVLILATIWIVITNRKFFLEDESPV